jgi:hypothetical protein
MKCSFGGYRCGVDQATVWTIRSSVPGRSKRFFFFLLRNSHIGCGVQPDSCSTCTGFRLPKVKAAVAWHLGEFHSSVVVLYDCATCHHRDNISFKYLLYGRIYTILRVAGTCVRWTL